MEHCWSRAKLDIYTLSVLAMEVKVTHGSTRFQLAGLPNSVVDYFSRDRRLYRVSCPYHLARRHMISASTRPPNGSSGCNRIWSLRCQRGIADHRPGQTVETNRHGRADVRALVKSRSSFMCNSPERHAIGKQSH
jgi:hypothetical protein